jgi:hypothetical protein
MKLDTRFFGKFSKLMDTLWNNAPLSNCTHLRRCIQDHLNFHLSSTSITIHGTDNLDAAETLRILANGSAIARLLLRDMLYQIQLENKAPLFLQLSQCASRQVDALIPNTPEAELLAKEMNVQIAAWCHFYWKSTNPGGERFHKKLSNHAFNQVMLHKIGKCEWDKKDNDSDIANIKIRAIRSNQIQKSRLGQEPCPSQLQPTQKKIVDPNAAFPFQDDFSIRRIHGTNAKAPSREQGADKSDVIEIVDSNDDASVLTTKTQDKLLDLLLQVRQKRRSAIGHWAASRTNPLVSSPTANTTPAGATETAPVTAVGLQIPTGTSNEGRVDGGPVGT